MGEVLAVLTALGKSGFLMIACLVLCLVQPLVPVNAFTPGFSSVLLGTVPRGVAVNSNTGVIYTLLYLNGTTLALDPQTLKTVAKVPTPSPYAVAIDSTTDRAYISQGQNASISVVDGSSDSVVATVQGAGTPFTLAVDETHDLVLGADPSESSLWIVNGSTDSIVAHVPLQSTAALAVDPANDEAFIGNLSSSSNNGTLIVVNSSTGSIVKTLQIPMAPSHFAFDPISHLLFITSDTGSSANFMAIDDRTFQTVYSMYLGGGPSDMAIGPSSTIFVSAVGSNRLYQINGSNGDILFNSTGDQAADITFTGITGMAYSPKTGDLYITENDVTSLIILGVTLTGTSGTTSSTTGTTTEASTSSVSSTSSMDLAYLYIVFAGTAAIVLSFVILRNPSRPR